MFIIVYELGSIPDWITAIVAIFALLGVWVAYRDYLEKTRPYVEVELETVIDEKSKNWTFLAKVLNKGQYPVYTKISKALLTVGDEKYPTPADKEFTIFPGEEKVKIPVGSIYEKGRKNIREAKYTKNTVELELEVFSRKIGYQNYKYKTYLKVQILVEEDKPDFILIEKKFT